MGMIVRSTKGWEQEIGARIRAIRKRSELTQQELADLANVSRSAIKYLEAGHGSSLATFIGVAKALNLDKEIDQIFALSSQISPMALLAKKSKSKRVLFAE